MSRVAVGSNFQHYMSLLFFEPRFAIFDTGENDFLEMGEKKKKNFRAASASVLSFLPCFHDSLRIS